MCVIGKLQAFSYMTFNTFLYDTQRELKLGVAEFGKYD